MTEFPHTPIQHRYPQDVAHCYGCGHLNPSGHHVQSHIEGDQTVAEYTPEPHHTAIPGYVYGGLIASLIDCHGTGTAAAAGAALAAADDPATAPVLDPGVLHGDVHVPRYVTAKLEVTYRRPTPLGPPLHLRGTVRERSVSKIVVDITVECAGEITATGVVVAAPMPDHMVGD
jgi:acyl-coenzyme A thioesterase PaaI-like protein